MVFGIISVISINIFIDFLRKSDRLQNKNFKINSVFAIISPINDDNEWIRILKSSNTRQYKCYREYYYWWRCMQGKPDEEN